MTPPRLRQVVLDGVDIRRLAEFHRRLLGYTYRPGDEAPPAGTADRRPAEWLVLVDGEGDRGSPSSRSTSCRR